MATPTSSSSSEMLVVSTSRECSLQGCHEHDFLPITCPGCQLPFCLSHHSPYLLSSSSHYHPCPSPPPDRTPLPCPLCAAPISTPPGADPNDTMDAHLGGRACAEAAARSGLPQEAREREERRAKRRRGEVCWVGRCRKGTKGGLGVRCDSCTHTFCLSHRTPSSHSCSPAPTPTPSSSGARKTPLSLSSAPINAGLAALRRQQQSQPPSKTAPAPTSTPKPLTAAQKSATPPTSAGQGGAGLKPVVNPFKGAGQKAVASRRSKAETKSRNQALAQRARLGLLSADEQLEWAVACAEGVSGPSSGGSGGAKAGKGVKGKDGCVVC